MMPALFTVQPSLHNNIMIMELDGCGGCTLTLGESSAVLKEEPDSAKNTTEEKQHDLIFCYKGPSCNIASRSQTD